MQTENNNVSLFSEIEKRIENIIEKVEKNIKLSNEDIQFFDYFQKTLQPKFNNFENMFKRWQKLANIKSN